MIIADLHIHSRYSRATSGDCVPEQLDLWARRKGIGLLGTGDFTHPAWRQELKEKLVPAEEGLYALREDLRMTGSAPDTRPRFVLSAEISSIYKQDGRTRKVHNVILLPGLEAADALSRKLEAIGNVHSDGRPILGLSSRDLLEITLDVCPEAIFIPAHIWTPHFSLFGAFSGFDTVEACFGDLTKYIGAVETGLSSDPPMNWRLSALDRFTLVSNSDAHSPAKLGREANLLDIDLSYAALRGAITRGRPGGFAGTLEFFPEEGKYHFDGHRNCGQCLSPVQAEEANGLCPVCGKRLTFGVLHRVLQLADRQEGYRPADALPFERLVPLPEVVAASIGASAVSKKTAARYEALAHALGDEFFILREAPLEDIARAAGPCVAEGIRRVRLGQIEAAPGYDGEFGRVQVLRPDEIEALSGQICFLPSEETRRRSDKTEASAPLSPTVKPHAAPETPAPADTPNERQQEAITAARRVVAVIAGPGTGKTKTLVSRIAHLIEDLGVKPERITAVTFTNKAAREMQARLEKRLGRRAAHAMTIGTFHAICLRLLSQEEISLADGAQALAAAQEAVDALALKTTARKLLSEISRRKNGLASTLEDEALAAYQASLARQGLRDFDDLLTQALAQDEAFSHRAFIHLLVDEFQDINPVQYELVAAWSKESESLFVIGDPDQSIYGFRGADAHCFERLLAAKPDAHVVRLQENYRSTPEILRSALPVVERDGTPRALVARRPSGARVRLLTAADEFAQALFIVKEIGRMVGGIDMLDAQEQSRGGAGRGFGDFAVLYRTHRQAEMLEMCLKKESIPYIVTGRDGTLEDEQVLSCVHFLRLALHPVLQANAAPQLLEKLSRFTPRAAKERPHKLIESFMLMEGIASSLAMERLLGIAALHQSLSSLLDTLSLGGEADISRCGAKAYTPDAVQLMTLHGSKGLEFPVVFLPGVNDAVLPLRMPGRETNEAEERRLFYVGMTRAKEELLLLTYGAPSPFLDDLPGASLRRERARTAARPAEGKQLSFLGI